MKLSRKIRKIGQNEPFFSNFLGAAPIWGVRWGRRIVFVIKIVFGANQNPHKAFISLSYHDKIKNFGQNRDFFDLGYPKLNPGMGKELFWVSESCSLPRKTPNKILDCEVIIKKSKIGKKGRFLTQFAPKTTQYGARDNFWLKNLVLRVKWTHKVFYFDRLGCS